MTARRLMWRAALAAAACAGCGGAPAGRPGAAPVAPRGPSAHRAADPAPARAADRRRADVQPAVSRAPAPGTIARADLLAVLDAGPGRFLAHVDVSPVFRGGAFAGWRIERFAPIDARLRGAPVRPGDVIVQVNGRPIARPEQLQRVWDDLRLADELVIDGERGGAPFRIRYRIDP